MNTITETIHICQLGNVYITSSKYLNLFYKQIELVDLYSR